MDPKAEVRHACIDHVMQLSLVRNGVGMLLTTPYFAQLYSVSTVDAPSVPIKPTRLRYLSQEEENSLLTALDPSRTSKFFAPEENRTPLLRREMQDNYDLVVFLLDTGARYGEIASLTWEQIDLEDRSIKLWRSKVGNESIIYMTSRVAKMMCRRSNIKSSERYVFTNRSGIIGKQFREAAELL